MVRMTRLYIDKEYNFRYEYNLSSYWSMLEGMYISFFILWGIEILVLSLVLRAPSTCNVIGLLAFSLLVKDLYIMIIFFVNVACLPTG